MPEGEDDGAGPLQNLEAVAELVRDGCGCNNANHFTIFEGVSIVDFQQALSAMSSREVDLYLMGLLAVRCTKCEPVRHHQSAAAAAQDRQRITFGYTCMGHVVCRTVFLKVHMIGTTRLRPPQKEVESNSCNPGQHGNFTKERWNKFPDDVICRTKQFIMNYAAVHGLPMPAAPRGRAHEAPTYLPASCTYKDVHAEYVRQSCDLRIMSYQSFARLWLAKCKSIKFMTRRMDVCYRCELLRDRIQKSRAEDEKIKATEALRSHVILAKGT